MHSTKNAIKSVLPVRSGSDFGDLLRISPAIDKCKKNPISTLYNPGNWDIPAFSSFRVSRFPISRILEFLHSGSRETPTAQISAFHLSPTPTYAQIPIFPNLETEGLWWIVLKRLRYVQGSAIARWNRSELRIIGNFRFVRISHLNPVKYPQEDEKNGFFRLPDPYTDHFQTYRVLYSFPLCAPRIPTKRA